MASVQGICKNCGSLIMLNDQEELCECLFCDCVFPSAEALEIARDTTARIFPNEQQPKREGVKRYNVSPVYPDPVPVAVKRAAISEAPKKAEKNPYEVTPDDIKAPRKVFWGVIGAAVFLVVLVGAIAWPLWQDKTNHAETVSKDIATVFSSFTVDTKTVDGYSVGYSLGGQKNETVAVTTTDKVSADDVLDTFLRYADLRAKAYQISADDFNAYYGSLRMTVYASNGGFVINVDSKDDLTTASVKTLS